MHSLDREMKVLISIVESEETVTVLKLELRWMGQNIKVGNNHRFKSHAETANKRLRLAATTFHQLREV